MLRRDHQREEGRFLLEFKLAQARDAAVFQQGRQHQRPGDGAAGDIREDLEGFAVEHGQFEGFEVVDRHGGTPVNFRDDVA